MPSTGHLGVGLAYRGSACERLAVQIFGALDAVGKEPMHTDRHSSAFEIVLVLDRVKVLEGAATTLRRPRRDRDLDLDRVPSETQRP